jgi:hypothetical protein
MTTTRVTPAMARHIEIWPIGRLVPYTKNARTHSPEQIAQIAASIVEFGFNAPILVTRTPESWRATVGCWPPASWSLKRCRSWCWITH